MTTASAPGKIILFGEHAVVYHRPALAVPVTQVHADVEITGSQPRTQHQDPLAIHRFATSSRRSCGTRITIRTQTALDHSLAGVWIDAPDISLHSNLAILSPTHALRSVVEMVLCALNSSAPLALTIRITSSIPVASGLGSGAAVSVALIRALSAHLGSPLNDEQVNNICYEIEKIHHGTPSGIDNTVITYVRPVYFIKGQPIEVIQVGEPFPIVIADTGIPASTKKSVDSVKKLWATDPNRWDQVFEQVENIVWQGRQAIESGQWQELGPLMDANHLLLQKMSVSSDELDRLVLAAKAAGALGAKLSGGGRGGNMIALVGDGPETAEKVASALLAAGATRTIITTVRGC